MSCFAVKKVYNYFMELPVQCSCGYENMADWGSLERRPLSKLYIAEGITCKGCGIWKPAWFTSRQLDEAMHKVLRYTPGSKRFRYYFAKALKYAVQIQQRGMAEYGKSKYKDMVIP